MITLFLFLSKLWPHFLPFFQFLSYSGSRKILRKSSTLQHQRSEIKNRFDVTRSKSETHNDPDLEVMVRGRVASVSSKGEFHMFLFVLILKETESARALNVRSFQSKQNKNKCHFSIFREFERDLTSFST